MNRSSGMDCEKFVRQLDDYIEGKLSSEQSAIMDEHADSCPRCRSMLDEGERGAGGDKDISLDVRKLESRFASRLFGRFVTAAAVVLMIWYVIFTALPQTVLSKTFMKKQLELSYGLEDLVQFTQPGAKVKSGWKGYIGLLETIGVVEYDQQLANGVRRSGKYDLAVPNYIGRNDWRSSSEVDGQHMGFAFNAQLSRGAGSAVDMTWDMLKEAEKGTMSTVAVYFETSATVQEMDALLASLGLFKAGSYGRSVWIGLDTGSLGLTTYGYQNSPISKPEWGFPLDIQITHEDIELVTRPAAENSKEIKPNLPGGAVSFGSSSVNSYKIELDMLASQALERWKTEMKNFERYSQHLGIKLLTEDIRKINSHLETGEPRIRGAILAAPTSSLLKLRDNKNIARVDIMKVDFDYSRYKR